MTTSADLPAGGLLDLVTPGEMLREEFLRLCRYFGLSEGYWLRLQMIHDLSAAKRRLGDALDKITPRVA